jgi:hypothetical protein
MVKSVDKKNKKEKLLKPLDKRIAFVEEMKGKFQNLGIPESYPGVQEFYKILGEYCNPTITSGFSGKVNIPEIQRKIEYILPMRLEIDPVVKLTQI